MKPIAHVLLATSLLLSSGPATGWGATPLLPSNNPPGRLLPDSIDRGFVEDAGEGLIFDVLAGSLALTHSGNPAVRKFARVETRDHSRDFARLTTLSNQLGIQVPSGTNDDQFDELQRLSLLFGPAFDQAYLRAAILRHLKDIDRYSEQARNGANPGLRAFANNRLGELYQHLQLAFVAVQKSGVKITQR